MILMIVRGPGSRVPPLHRAEHGGVLPAARDELSQEKRDVLLPHLVQPGLTEPQASKRFFSSEHSRPGLTSDVRAEQRLLRVVLRLAAPARYERHGIIESEPQD